MLTPRAFVAEVEVVLVDWALKMFVSVPALERNSFSQMVAVVSCQPGYSASAIPSNIVTECTLGRFWHLN